MNAYYFPLTMIGFPGPRGDRGVPGGIGLKGIRGPAGDSGPRGLPGPKGMVGDQGDVGRTGPSGPLGFSGPQGANGAKGDTGLPGLRGMMQQRSTGNLHSFWGKFLGEDLRNVIFKWSNDLLSNSLWNPLPLCATLWLSLPQTVLGH